MAGHSKWANIKRRKARVDAARSNIISKALRDIMLAAKHGGGNPDANVRLKLAVDRAKQANVSLDSINRAIGRGTGELEGGQIDELTYECYGPGGAAILVQAATDNRNRTASEIRYVLSKHGGKLADIGSVAWMFEDRGFIVVSKNGLAEEDAFVLAIDGGALDFKAEEDSYEIYCETGDVQTIKELLEQNGAIVEDAELIMVPNTTVSIEGNDARKIVNQLEALEEHDDVQRVFTNFDIPDEILESLAAEN